MLKTQNYSIDNFIGIFDNYLPSIAIDKSIEWFEKEEKQKNSFDRLSQGCTENFKKDTSVELHFKQNDGWLQEIPGLVENLMFAVGIYLERVPLKSYLNYEDLEFNTMKIQKTLPGEGYHMWHVEASDNLELLKRVIAFSVYLMM